MIIGRIGTRITFAFHGTGQIHIVAQGVFGLLDGTQIPIEPFGADSDLFAVEGNRLGGGGVGVIDEVLRHDQPVAVENVARSVTDQRRVSRLSVRTKGNLLHHSGRVALTGAYQVTFNPSGLIIAALIDVVGHNFDGGIVVSTPILRAEVCHLQVVFSAHLVVVYGVAGRLENIALNALKCSIKLIGRGSKEPVVVRGSHLLHNTFRVGSFGLLIIVKRKADGIHRSAQTGNRGHILVGTGSGVGLLINHFVILRGVTLDRFVPAVLLCIGADTAEVILVFRCLRIGHTVCRQSAALRIENMRQCLQVISLIIACCGAIGGTVQPVAPCRASAIGMVAVVLHGRTVGHKHDHQVSILVVCRIIALNSGTQLIGGPESIVVVGTGLIG